MWKWGSRSPSVSLCTFRVNSATTHFHLTFFTFLLAEFYVSIRSILIKLPTTELTLYPVILLGLIVIARLNSLAIAALACLRSCSTYTFPQLHRLQFPLWDFTWLLLWLRFRLSFPRILRVGIFIKTFTTGVSSFPHFFDIQGFPLLLCFGACTFMLLNSIGRKLPTTLTTAD